MWRHSTRCAVSCPRAIGATPLFAALAPRVWWIDVAGDALRLVEPAPPQRSICKDWFAATTEIAAADVVVGDGAFNALDGPASGERLVRLLRDHRKAGATHVQRVFLRHELPPSTFRDRLAQAFAGACFSEVRFLVYGVVAQANGLTAIADIDRFVASLETHLDVDRATCATWKADYFAWRGLSPAAAAAITTTAYFPSRSQIESMFRDAGVRVTAQSPGRFSLAEFTPIYVARD
jgi:hypothetical protein